MEIPRSVVSLSISFLINFIIFVVLFCIFVWYRKIRNGSFDPSELGPDVNLKLPAIPETNLKLKEALKAIYKISKENLATEIGDLGVFLLRLNQRLTYLYSMIAILGVALVIFYGFGDSELDDDDNRGYLGIAHIIDSSTDLVVSAVSMIVISLVCYYITYLVFLTKGKRKFKSSAVIIRNLPMEDLHSQTQELTDLLQDFQVKKLYVVPNWGNAYAIRKKYKLALKQFNYHTNLYKLKDKKKKRCCSKVYAVDYHENACKEHMQELINEYDKGKTSSGVAFVVFNERMDDIMNHQFPENKLKANEWEISAAPNKSEIRWDNIPISYPHVIHYILAFLLVFFILLTPTAIVGLLEDGMSSIGLLSSFFSSYLVTLVMVVYQSVLIPMAVTFIVNKEKHWNKDEQRGSWLTLYLNFSMFYLFIYPIFGLQVRELIDILISGSDEWTEKFAGSINLAGEFFSLYIVQQIFIKNGFDLLVLPRYFLVKFKEKAAIDDNEKLLAYQAPPFPYEMYFASDLNVFMMAICFSVVFPLILIPALIYSLLRYWVIKYNVLCVFYTKKTLAVGNMVKTIIKRIVFYTYFMQLFTGIVFVLNEDYYAVSVVTLIVSTILCIVLQIVFNRINYENTEPEIFTFDSYRHPLIKEYKRYISN